MAAEEARLLRGFPGASSCRGASRCPVIAAAGRPHLLARAATATPDVAMLHVAIRPLQNTVCFLKCQCV